MEEGDEEEAFDRLARFFPAFHWVIRDFTLELEDDVRGLLAPAPVGPTPLTGPCTLSRTRDAAVQYANPISPDQYMEAALHERGTRQWLALRRRSAGP